MTNLKWKNEDILKSKDGLLVPKSYLTESKEKLAKIQNGCGPDGLINFLIPDSLAGLDISDICDVHDYMFATAHNQKDLKKADQIFLKNMVVRVKKEPGIKAFGRKLLAYIYYKAVRIYSWFQQ